MGLFLAIVGIGLAVSQIVDEKAASALLALWDGSLSKENYARLLTLEVQVGITVLIMGLAFLTWLLYKVMGWANRIFYLQFK